MPSLPEACLQSTTVLGKLYKPNVISNLSHWDLKSKTFILESLCSIPPTSQSTALESSKGTSSKPCNNCCSVSNRSCTKVLKYGTALGRAVDLARFNGYKDLVCELDRMFDFNGRLIDGSSGWHATYTDEEGDMMMIGDHYPWQKFQYEVRRMLVSPKERLNPSSTNSTSH